MPSVQESLSHDPTSVHEALSVMLSKEQTVYKSYDYLSTINHLQHLPSSSCDDKENAVITSSDRQLIVDWCYSIVDACQFDRETVALAMEMIDRFLSQSSISTTMSDDNNSLPSSSSTTTQLYLTNRKQYQLLSMSSLYIAIKAHEPIAFASDMFASMSNGLYTISDIEEMECYILKTLQWNINCPTNVQFAYHILSLIYKHLQSVDDEEESSSVVDESTWCFILDETRFQIEYALRDYSLSNNERGSTVALASILNALDQVTNEDEKQCILHTLLSVMKSYNFDSLDQVYVVKDRLSNFVSGNDSSSSSNTESSRSQEEAQEAAITPVASPATSTTSSPVTTKSVNSTTSASPRTSMWSSSR